MLPNKDILSELSEISPALTTINRNNVYSVPLNYFDSLASNINDRIKNDSVSQTVSEALNKNTFAAPPGYFDTLPAIILNKIAESHINEEVYNELLEVAPILNTISRKMPNKITPGYFETLSDNISAKYANTKSQAAVKKLSWYKTAYKYAAAAVIAGLVIMSTFLLAPDDKIENNSSNYTSTINISSAVNNITEAEITDFLNNNNIIPEAAINITITNDDVDFLQVLENTSEEDIQDYLKEYEVSDALKVKNS